MTVALLPCPYCGGAPKQYDKFPGARTTWCSNQPVNCANRSMYTVEEWNRRAPAQPAQITSHACIDWNEISRRGLLVRINQEIMHPLGLAVARNVDTGQSPGALVSPDGAWAYAGDTHEQ